VDCAGLGARARTGELRATGTDSRTAGLTRYRKSVIQERTRHANRVHKTLEDAGVKLAAVANDILGASGRAMLEALVQGTTILARRGLAEMVEERFADGHRALRRWALASRRGHVARVLHFGPIGRRPPDDRDTRRAHAVSGEEAM
jgi:hypothetical protein